MNIMDKIKKCRKCDQVSKHRKKSGRVNEWLCYCRNCESRHQRRRCSSRKQEYLKLLGGQCSKCGLRDHDCVFDFHHTNPEIKTNVISKIPRKLRDKEILKCEILCGICHRKHNHQTPKLKSKDKCVLLCCMCHRKLHANIIRMEV